MGEPNDSMQWFVLHTLSGQEYKVKESMERRIKLEEMEDYIEEVLIPDLDDSARAVQPNVEQDHIS